MLTGDKMETAENIAKSCRLIQGDFTVMRLSDKEEKVLMHKLVDNQETYELCVKEKRKKVDFFIKKYFDYIIVLLGRGRGIGTDNWP